MEWRQKMTVNTNLKLIKNDMNRLVLIGNGFDMAHGLKTSYNDFSDELLPLLMNGQITIE